MINREPFVFIRRHRRFALFSVVYLLGLVAGILFITRCPVSFWMRLLIYPQMSIVVGLLMSALPFVVFYIVFRCSAFFLITPLAFIKSFTFMYCFAGISIAYADAGWLMRSLLLFTDCFSVPLLIWYVSGLLLEKQNSRGSKIWFCLLFVFAIRCIDYFVVSPFVLELLSF